MPNKSTYYTDEEIAAIEDRATKEGKSFSKVVREAVQEELEL